MVASLRKFFQSSVWVAIVISVVGSLITVGAYRLGSLEFLELAAYDWSIRFQPLTTFPNPRIVLVTINENDIRHEGRWPLPDASIAALLETLIAYQPRAIGLDIYRDLEVLPGRDALDSVLQGHQEIVAITKFGEGEFDGIPAPPVLEGSGQVGFNDILVDSGGMVRRGLLFMDHGDSTGVSFALLLALRYLEADGIVPESDPVHEEYMKLGMTSFRPFEANDGGYVGADASGYQFLLDHALGRTPFPSHSLTEVMTGAVPPDAFRNKIVMIGVTAEGVKDYFYTPHSQGVQAGQQVPGIQLHANIADQILRASLDGNATITPITDRQEMLLILLWGLLGGAVGLVVRAPLRFSLILVVGFVIIGSTAFYAVMVDMWVPLVGPAIAWFATSAVTTAYMSMQEKQQRTMLMHLFSRHVSPEVAETIWRGREQFLDGGRLRPHKLMMTSLFTDLEGFTTVSEGMDPPALMDWLNTFMERMAKLVMDHGGVVDNYMGDAIKADFGVPFARTHEDEIRKDVENAVTCALAMWREMIPLSAFWQKQGLPIVRMRVGIATGPAVVGCLGSSDRLKYTTVGDTVNTAARLESLKKELVDSDKMENICRILISETTKQYLDHTWRIDDVGSVELKGKQQSIGVFIVIGRDARGIEQR